MELSSLNEVRIIVLLQETNNFDETNNFFMNSYQNKIENFVKLMWKVSMRWKNWSDFKGLHSIHFREGSWSKIETLSLDSQPRFRNNRKELIVWMIWEIFNDAWICTQWSNPTLPVNQRVSHLFKILAECWAVIWECRAATMGHQVFGTRMVYRETFFLQIQTASSAAPYPQELQSVESPIVSRSRFFRPQCDEKWKARHKIRIWDASLDRQPKNRFVLEWREDSFNRVMGADQQRLQISDLSFWQIPFTSATFACWKIRFKTVVCICSQFLTEALHVDQRSGDGWNSGWSKNLRVLLEDIRTPDFEVLDAEDCFSTEPNHS